jgi:hypothetical protein
MIGSEQHFRSTFGPERAGVLLQALAAGSSRARHLSVTEGFVEARTEPTVAFDLSTKNLDGRFDAEPGVRRALVNGQILWIVDETFAVRVKKLKSGYRASNHESGQQAAITAQLPLDDMPSLIYLTAGTRYSHRTGLAEEYVVVKHRASWSSRQVVEWVVDLEDLAAGGLAPTAPVLPLGPSAPPTPAAAVLSKRRPAVRVNASGSQ